MPRFGSSLPKLDDVFKSHPKREVLKDLITAQRLQAIDILQNVMPIKIVEIRNLIKQEEDPSSMFFKDQVFEVIFTDVNLQQPSSITQDGSERKVIVPNDLDTAQKTEGHNSPDAKIGDHWFEVLKPNPVHAECMKIVAKELEEVHMISQNLKVWLELEIPIIEDGNSFGADVQNHLIKELTDVKVRSNNMSNGVRAHHSDRLKLAMDWAKYPNFQDFAEAISKSDQYDHFLLRSYLRTILIMYSGLLTKFERNWPKVINPKGSHEAGAMY
ncbi:uncharacterized protein L201_007778 [Kwoniella dendrophila CBS 6074]|uniref:Proteasome activator PA28 C-terminal domain-containing protein n=1 Tax=Kwoniella dendrophila CBS 6074 TaxID=1295534 RepID=A0AAX4K5Z9_9TREE